MRDWFHRYKLLNVRTRYFSVVGNCIVLFFAARELVWMGSTLATFGPIPTDMFPNITWDLVAHVAVAIFCLYRVIALVRPPRGSYPSLIFSGVMCTIVLLVYWADHINLWTCYLAAPESLICNTFVSGRPDVLAGIAPSYAILGTVRVFVLSFLVTFQKSHDLDPNS